jgi:hypothetical protein
MGLFSSADRHRLQGKTSASLATMSEPAQPHAMVVFEFACEGVLRRLLRMRARTMITFAGDIYDNGSRSIGRCVPCSLVPLRDAMCAPRLLAGRRRPEPQAIARKPADAPTDSGIRSR